MNTKDLSAEQLSTLLYLETRAVDHGGRVEAVKLNTGDMQLCREWHDEGFIEFRRLSWQEVRGAMTHKVSLSDDAWQIAHSERRKRAERSYEG